VNAVDRRRVTSPGPDPLAAGYDLDGIPPGATPRRSIVVCAAPGIRPDLVTAALRHCGAGVPMEYFDLDAVAAPLVRRWLVLNLDEYITALHHHRTTADGVFGVMLQWAHLRRLQRRVEGVTQLTAARTLPVIAELAPSADFVFVRDEAIDTQAVRLAMTRATAGTIPEPRDVAAQLTLIEATEHSWLRWFDDAGVSPVQLTVSDDPAFDPSLDHLATLLGLPPPPAPPDFNQPALSPQGQSLLRRFRAERASGTLEIHTLHDG
jgi:LPS sulfotransferase NodH